MKGLKDYRPDEFGANRDTINSLIMEQASECAVKRMEEIHKLPFEAFTELDIEEGEDANDDTPTRYKEEFQEEYNQLYDEEYNRIATEIGFDFCAEDGVLLQNNSEFWNRISTLRNDILETIKNVFRVNGLTQIDLSEVKEPVYVVWWGLDGYTKEGAVVQVKFEDGNILLEVEYENETVTIDENDFAMNHPIWLNCILENIKQLIR